MGKKTAKANNLGRSLIRDRFGHGKRTVGNDTMLHTTEIQDGYDWGRLNLQSVTEESSFQEFLRTAELAGTEFQAEKLNIAFVNPKSTVGILTEAERIAVEKKHAENKNLLKIPRRPKWTEHTTATELTELENFDFLEWRRQLATLQEDDSLIMTPYEKNLEFWRQLWRVIERSDVVVQIVDARNPLLFRNEDLERYVKEVNKSKMNMILVNKADFLSDRQRRIWADYFSANDVHIVFYSALLAEQKIKEQMKEIKEEEARALGSEGVEGEEDSDNESSEECKGELINLTKTAETSSLIEPLNLIESSEQFQPSDDIKILSREDLIAHFKTIYTGPRQSSEGVITIGLVGYPNVGKSSTINTLMYHKKVSVSATPGKTKHFQTLYVDTELMLCDSPGLVMPSFVATKADMILNGILPIDQMRDFVPPVNLLCTQIPRHILEDKYGIIIARPQEGEDSNRPPFAEELLLAYGYNRGFMTANGQPDQARSSRYILKHYVAGQLLYCNAPPTVSQSDFHIFPDRSRPEVAEETLPKQRQRALRINRIENSNELDNNFFGKKSLGAYVKGKSNFPHIRVTSAEMAIKTGAKIGDVVVTDKPWRKQKKEKREKLRRKFAHLDQH